MTREEAIKVVEENRVNYRDWKQEEFDKAIIRLNQPLTLADFLGWEEGETYKVGWDGIREMSITDDEILIRKTGTKTKVTWDSQRNLPFLLNLFRNAEKVDKTKYYAKIKGWDNEKAQTCNVYWNHCCEDDTVLASSKSENHKYKTKYTKSAWNKLGINDTNADFDEVEE